MTRDALLAAFADFADAVSWLESRDVLVAHPELLDTETEAVLRSFIASLPAGPARDWGWACFGILARASVLGISSEYTEIAVRGVPELGDLAAELEDIDTRLSRDERLQPERLPVIEKMLARLPASGDTELLGQVRWMLLNERGLCLHSLRAVPGKRQENLDQAIASYSQALELISHDEAPVRYGEVCYNLGNAYLSRHRDDRASSVELAIGALSAAVGALTPQSAPETYGEACANLGTAYLERQSGDWAADIERAIMCLREAQRVFTQDRYPHRYADTEEKIGTAYFNLPIGDRAENVGRAIECYERALRSLTPQTRPLQYARAKHNLGIAYAWRGGRANLARAIDCYTQALRFRTAEDAPDEYARTMTSLGEAYAELCNLGVDMMANMERAIDCYHEALRFRTARDTPNDYAYTMVRLAKAYSTQRDRHPDAVSFFNRVLAIADQDVVPGQHREAAVLLGQLHFGDRQWEQAHAAFASAIKAGDRLYREAAFETGRQTELAGNANAVAADAYCLARLGRLTEAAECLEDGRARALAEALGRGDGRLAGASAADQRAFRAASERLRALESAARAWPPPDLAPDGEGPAYLRLATEITEARTKIAALTCRVSTDGPGPVPASGTRSMIRAAASRERPLTYLVSTSHGCLALIVTADSPERESVHALWLDGLTSATLGESSTVRAWAGGPAAGELTGDVPNGYLRAELARDTGTLAGALPPLLATLKDAILRPLAIQLKELGATQVTLIPVGMLSLFPLPASAPAELVVALAPSARGLLSARGTLRQRSGSRPVLVGVGNPKTQARLRPLNYAADEVAAVAAFFDADARRVLAPDQASLDGLRRQLPGATHLHLACHGRWEVGDPLSSALRLAGTDRLSLRDLFDGKLDLPDAWLVVLSACESGRIQAKGIPDELVGLPAGFLQAGSPGVLASLWPADDVSTVVLMESFYTELMTNAADPATALHRAMSVLREGTARELDLAGLFERRYEASGGTDRDARLTAAYYRAHPDDRPYGDPIYWAGFTYTGA